MIVPVGLAFTAAWTSSTRIVGGVHVATACRRSLSSLLPVDFNDNIFQRVMLLRHLCERQRPVGGYLD